MSLTERRSTLPATIAAALLAARYAGFAGFAVYFVRFARARGLENAELETWFLGMTTVWGLLAALWTWTAICCARRKPSWVPLVTIGVTAVDIAVFVVTSLVGSLTTMESLDAVALVRTLIEIALVAVVIVWRPRLHPLASSAPLPAR